MTKDGIDLAQLVKNVAEQMFLDERKHRIRVTKAEQATINGNRDRLEQVVRNLIDNAIKFSPRGGDIDIALAVRDREAAVSVRDYGVGIPKEKQRHIFERFYS